MSIIKSEKELVTAVITTCKREPSIVERALKSIIDQTYPNLEIIVVNDYPEDKELVSQLKKMIDNNSSERKIEYIILDKNSGACKARNIGIEKAQGKYIGFLDDDDEWKPTKVEKCVSFLKENLECKIVYSNAEIYNETTGNITLRFSKNQVNGDVHKEILYNNFIGSCSFPMFDAKILKECGGFSEEMPALQDWELYIRLSKKTNVGYIDDPLTKYYKYEGERISKNSQKRVDAYSKLFSKFQEDILADKKSAYNFYIAFSAAYSINRDFKNAMKVYNKAIKLCPFKIKNNSVALAKIIVRTVYNKNNL